MTLSPVTKALRTPVAHVHSFGLPWSSADYVLSCIRKVEREQRDFERQYPEWANRTFGPSKPDAINFTWGKTW